MSKYIDADKMLKEYEHSIYDTTDLAEMLNYMPAADVQEVQHGKWVIHFEDKGFHGTQCSCCGFVWSEEIAAVKVSPVFSRIYTPYCPNCGAKMED